MLVKPSGMTTKLSPRWSSSSSSSGLVRASALASPLYFFASASGNPQERNRVQDMYLDMGTIVAICILIVTQLAVLLLTMRSAYRWERHYWDVVRLLKIERAQR